MSDLFSSPPDPSVPTSGGGRFNLFRPDPAAIDLEDLAVGLARVPRFLGRTPVAYSVAQHSVMVARWCRGVDAAWGLLHDAAEAWLWDWPRPIKRHVYFRDPDDGDHLGGELIAFDELEARILAAVAERFGLPSEGPPVTVSQVDDRVLATEIRDLWGESPDRWTCCDARPYPGNGTPICAIGEHFARRLFLDKARDLGIE